MSVIEYLSDNSLQTKCCFIDNNYFEDGKKCLSVPVISFSKFEKQYKKCNVIYSINTFSQNFPAWETVRKIQSQDGRKVFYFELEYLLNKTTEKEIPSDYLRAHTEDFEETYLMLADKESKDVFLAYLRAKTGIVNIPEIPHIAKFWKENQYFNSLVEKSDLLNTKNIFVDCGAFTGDTAENFANCYPTYKKIIAFEPDSKNYEKLIEKKESIKGLECVKKGVWDKETELSFVSDGTSAAKVIESEKKSCDSISVTSVDIQLGGEPATFIKMDIEGSELKALHGCSETIKKYMPFLAICVYHKRSDLIEIPAFIESLAKQNTVYRYEYYLRHHSYFTDELVLYAVPKRVKQ